MENKNEISLEDVGKFLEGRDPEERIVNLLYRYQDPYITVVYRNKNDQKCTRKENFYPFVWATRHACLQLCHGNRQQLLSLMNKYSISVKKLSNTSIDGKVRPEFENGYMFLFYANRAMSYSKFLDFFKKCEYPVQRDRKDKNGKDVIISKEDENQFLSVTPQEQFMISTGKRFFKGYTDYNGLLRMIFDLETEGLDPHKDRIKLNGIRLNRPVTINGKTYHNFERIFEITGTTKEEKDASELKVIDTMLKIIFTFKPDVISAHNGENFDWNFIIVRCKELGTSMEDMSKPYFDGDYIRKETRESSLKLGGEVETFYRTIVPNTIITDSLHAVRRAQATDSNFLKATLKYSTEYLSLKKDNRVYTPGEKIDEILIDKVNQYAFNNTDGDWYLYDPNSSNGSNIPFRKGKDGDKPFVMYTRNYLAEGYEIVTGEYIIKRYLLDDLWECDKVEYTLNTTNFFICKILPVPFAKCCTMGTAGQWKAIMMAWSYENNLAIPKAENTGAFTGGLSRLLRVGFVDDVVKLDYNSLYPSIILTWGISDDTDLMNAMLKMLEYVLTQREKYKKDKKAAEKIVEKYEKMMSNNPNLVLTDEQRKEYEDAQAAFAFADRKQNQMKVLGNSFFGSYGSNNGSVFPWKSPKCAEQTTCTGRQSLRLMISHFHKLGYTPIVGDSVVGDTPLFIKYKGTGFIDIKPISEIMNYESAETDYLGRKYDSTEKPYQVLCRNGWQDIDYVYCHETDKDIYEVTDNKTIVECTSDHSLFNSEQKEIKPTQITIDTELEYYMGDMSYNTMSVNFSEDIVIELGKQLADGTIDRVPLPILNGSKTVRHTFYKVFMHHQSENVEYSKTCIAGIQFLIKK